MQKSLPMTNTRHAGAGNELSTLFHSDALPVGTLLSEFEITGLLGVGGFGMVYGAYDLSLQRTVAIKEYMPSALAGRADGLNLSSRASGDQEAFSAGLRSFVTEARLLAQFDHPSLVKVYRFWEANNTAYMVMPFYKGLTFKHARAQAQSPPPEDWLRAMLWPVLGALSYLHERQVVHRDISPDNIFLQEAGPPVLLDLGAARRAISGISQKYTAILKVNYAPIEQYADADDLAQGPWTDLYALAAVVHGSLCNAPPLPATFRVVRDRLPSFASVAKTVETLFGLGYSREFVKAFEQALAIQPKDRPQSVQAFIEKLGLAAPLGPHSLSWRSENLVSAASPVADSEAKTVFQAPRKPVTAVDAPETDSAPLEHISAYGVLEQESPELTPQKAPEPSSTPFPDLPHTSGQANPSKSKTAHRASASAPTVAVAPASIAKVKMAVIATVCGVALLAGAWVWNAKAKRAETQMAQPPAASPAPVAPVAATADKTAPRPNAIVPTPTPTPPPAPAQASTVAPNKPPGAAAAQKPKSPAKAVGDAPASVPEVAPVPTAAAAPGISTSPLHSPVAAKASAAKARPGPVENCADKNFLVRPMCIHQECEKPEFIHTTFCVENARRLKESARSNDR